MYKPSFYNIIIQNGLSPIVFNAVSGAIARFDNDTLLKMMDPSRCSNLPESKKMAEKGFLVSTNIDEWSRLVFDRQCFIFNPSPTTIGFVITPTLACNMKCPYCFENDGRQLTTMNENIMFATLAYIKKEIEDHPSVKDISIVWFGGEPCLQSNLIVSFCDSLFPYLKVKGIGYYSRIATNGVLLTSELAHIFRDRCNITDAQITIDGLSKSYSERKRCHESDFFQLIENIKQICDVIKVNLRVNVDSDNQNEIPELLAFLLETNGLNGKVNLYFAQIQNWNAENGRNYLDDFSYCVFLKRIHHLILEKGWEQSFVPKRPVRQVGPCGSMRNTNATIGPDGIIYRCEHCLNLTEWAIGDVIHGKLHNEKDLMFLCKPILDKCKFCKAFPICAGGCAANELLHGLKPVNCENYVDIIKENVVFAVLSREKANNT